MNRVFRSFAIAVAMAASLAVAPNAVAATDLKGPSLSVPATPNFVVGQVLADPVDLYETGELDFMNGPVLMEYRWTASDPSRICRYSVDEHHGVEEWSNGVVDYRTNATTGRHRFNVDGYPNSDDTDILRVNAYDCAGNKTSVQRRGSWTAMEKDYGPSVPAGWARTSCTCAMGDSMLRTSTYKTSLSTVVSATTSSRRVALVMAKGPARGRASVYFDGKYVTTVDTYAATNTNRVVMWDTEIIAGTGNHTIKVVNQATSGRPRIDIDGYVAG
jgi:hypothetical protein